MPLDERTVRGLIAQGSGLESKLVYPGNDRGVRPATGNYCTVLFIGEARTGAPSYEQLSGGRTRTSTPRRASYSVQFYRSGASRRAYDFEFWAESELGLAAMLTARLVVVFPIEVERIDDLVGPDLEERSVINLDIDYVQERVQATGIIDQVSGTLVSENSGGVTEELISHG